jgi:hypothetical protein
MVRGGGMSWNGRREGKVGVSMGDRIWKKERTYPRSSASMSTIASCTTISHLSPADIKSVRAPSVFFNPE